MIKKVTETYELSELELVEIIQSYFEEKMNVFVEQDDITLYQWNSEILCQVKTEMKL